MGALEGVRGLGQASEEGSALVRGEFCRLARTEEEEVEEAENEEEVSNVSTSNAERRSDERAHHH